MKVIKRQIIRIMIVTLMLMSVVTGCASWARSITTYSLDGVAGTISGQTITVNMPYGTNVTDLVATFTTTGSSVKVGSTVQVSGVTPNNFTNPVVYTVIAQDGTTEEYTVTVKVAVLDSLPQTGQTGCYDASGNAISCSGTGQDGDSQEGVAWPSQRFTTNSDATVTDNLTGLIWMPDGSTPTLSTCAGGAMAWQDGLNYVSCLNTYNYLGHSDWRLPNRNELRSLVNYEKADTYSWLNTQGFSNVQSGWYWSSTTDANLTSSAWYVDMDAGDVGDDVESDFYYVWPVRAGQGGVVEIPRTGQTASYSSGDDGSLQDGVSWPSKRFTTNSDTTVTDNLTGLIWMPDGSTPTLSTCAGGVMTWQDGLNYVSCLNTNSYLGYSDWRLPNINELEILLNAGSANTGTWLNTQGFSNVQSGWYWSSTTDAGETVCAWSVSMYGQVTGTGKTYTYYVWPVRGGS
ncbi:MAG: DUF1566 domain-containing protein [Smithella sp.]